MQKQFIPLNLESPPRDVFLPLPEETESYKVRGYQQSPQVTSIDPCCFYKKRECLPRQKPKLIEEDIYEFYRKRLIKRDLSANERIAKCRKDENFTYCVVTQRTTDELKTHSIARENYLRTKKLLQSKRHEFKETFPRTKAVIKLQDPKKSGEGGGGGEGGDKVDLKIASPSCSMEAFYVPTRKLLDIKKPKSGIFINQYNEDKDALLPFQSYNPRTMQQQIDRDYTLFKLNPSGDGYFTWYKDMNENETSGSNQIHRLQNCLGLPAFRGCLKDCINFEPRLFPIPNDLHKTFMKNISVLQANGVLIGQQSSDYRRPKELACDYVAFTEIFVSNPDLWDADTLDNILERGDDLHAKSVEIEYEDKNADFDIIPEVTDSNATVELHLHYSGELIGNPNILKVMTLFFNRYNAGILCCEDKYLLIWRHCANTFKVFDSNARDENGFTDYAEGKTSVLTTSPIEHVVHMILNLSCLHPSDHFSLYEIRLKDFGFLHNPMVLERPARLNKKMYIIVNKFYALVPSAGGILTPLNELEVNASMMIAFITLVYSQVDPPMYWSVLIVDALIKYAKQRFKDFMDVRGYDDLNINQLPRELIFGSYRAFVSITPFVMNGQVAECLTHKHSLLTHAIEDVFKEHEACILQIDSSAFAIWKDSNFLYLLDPFKRGIIGLHDEEDENSGVGCLQLHINVNSLCRILYKNALLIKTAGNFFIHTVKIDRVSVFSPNRQMLQSHDFDTLRIVYPFPCFFPPSKYRLCEQPKPVESLINLDCLSILSDAPCERVCSESDFIAMEKQMKKNKAALEKLERSYSVPSILDEDRIPYFDSSDVVESLWNIILCDVMTEIDEKYRRDDLGIQAKKILLKSDMDFLEEQKRKFKRGDIFEDFCDTLPTDDRDGYLTLEDELEVVSNFISLPDGSWIIFSGSTIKVHEENYGNSILAAMMSVVISKVYKICSWNSTILDYIYSSSLVLADSFRPFKYIINLILKRDIPVIQLGEDFKYKINISKKASGDIMHFRKTLEAELLQSDRMLIVFNAFSCAVFRRYNFFYLYCGFPTDIVGFRMNNSGKSCFTRYTDIETMWRRIEFGRLNAGDDDAFLICHIHAFQTEVEKMPYVQRTESNEQLAIQKEKARTDRYKQMQRDRLKLIETEIKKEKQRIVSFKQLKKQFEEEKRRKQAERYGVPYPGDDEDMDEEQRHGEEEEKEIMDEEEGQDEVYPKHSPGREISKMKSIFDDPKIKPTEVGYRLCQQDCLFKIQGSKKLADRNAVSTSDIKTCHFAAIFAILSAVLKPLRLWDGSRIDSIIEKAKYLGKKVKQKAIARERIIRNILIDDLLLNIIVKEFDGIIPYDNVKDSVKYVTHTHKYFIVQTSNCSFAIYKDEYYHLFDSYATLEKSSNQEEDEGDEEEEECSISPQKGKFKDKNTASWVLFADLDDMFKYIGKRSASKNWTNKYKILLVNITKYKKASKDTQRAEALNRKYNEPEDNEFEEDILCIKEESVSWLNIYPRIVSWSRLLNKNKVGLDRGHDMAIYKAFDVEIPDRLWSLWGTIHPSSIVFEEYRGKQYLAIDVLAICIVATYRLTEWNYQIIDNIVVHGDRYFRESTGDIDKEDYEFTIEDLGTSYRMEHMDYKIHIESVVFGRLYNKKKRELNLAASMGYFFSYFSYGVIQARGKSLAFGRANKGYFLFDCQSYGFPLFQPNEGSAYILRTSTLERLVYCIVMTFNFPYNNIDFVIHKVELSVDEASGDGEEEEGGNEEAQPE